MLSGSIFRTSGRLALAIGLLMLASLARASAADVCPHVMMLESSNGQYYVAVFAAPVRTKASIGITLYSKSNGFTASLTQLSIDKPWDGYDPDTAYRSYTAVFRNPTSEPFIGAVVHPFDLPHDTNCPPEEYIIPSIDEVKTPSKAPSATETALENAVIDETGDGSGAFPLTPIAIPPAFACAAPFSTGHILELAKNDYAKPPGSPDLSAQVRIDVTAAGVVKTATISRSSGNADFDAAAVAAAKKTTYAPRIFGCTPESATYYFTSRS